VELPVYLDYAASTPVDEEVAAAMSACLCSPAGMASASASHARGREASALLEQARASVAALINAAPAEIIFSSGATESNNLAVIGAARYFAGRGRHLVTALSEHSSVLEAFRYLERNGFRVSWLQPDRSGRISADAVAAALGSDTTLLSLMHVNNETGVIQDLAAIGAVCRERGVLLHSDAAQSAGKLPLDVRTLPVDMLSLSAHKMGGPKGAGALYLNQARVRRVEPLLYGGGQERGLRSGTPALHQAVGLATACRLATVRMAADEQHLLGLREALWAELAGLQGVLRNGDPAHCAAHILNVSFTGVNGESLLYALPELALGAGAACSSGSGQPSHVLRSLGRAPRLAESSLRFSFGRQTTRAEISFAAERVCTAVAALRRIAPAATQQP